jgi:uncharacterized cupin superfamily protein
VSAVLSGAPDEPAVEQFVAAAQASGVVSGDLEGAAEPAVARSVRLSFARMDEPFVMNVADAPAMSHPRRAMIIDFEGEDRVWPDTGVNIQVMQPGQPNCRYHSEPVQEDFLVLYGECIVVLEGEERPLRQWDFLHCPAGVEHVFVGAGDGPCAVLMIGSRRKDEAHYPVNEVAAKYDASVSRETDEPAEAYADWRAEPWNPTQNPWPLARPT